MKFITNHSPFCFLSDGIVLVGVVVVVMVTQLDVKVVMLLVVFQCGDMAGRDGRDDIPVMNHFHMYAFIVRW